jgi:D-beta-D-heptose 7-phosphate kinase/D-beta-D-heptose 1-phosphate adenosyltransferase
MKILVIGESCNDVYCYGSVNRLAPEAPVPVLQPIKKIEVGGMAMNVYENLKSLNIECDIATNKNWKEITKKRFIDDKTNQMFLRVDTNDSSYGKISYEEIVWDNYDAIIISDYDKGYLSKEDIEYICTNHNKVFLDTKKILGNYAKKAHFIKINNYEYDITKNEIDAELNNILIITLGGNGCKYKDEIFPVPKVDVKDTCGAGDTFIASLVFDYLKSNNIKKSIIFANKCATQVIQKRGTSKVNLELI